MNRRFKSYGGTGRPKCGLEGKRNDPAASRTIQSGGKIAAFAGYLQGPKVRIQFHKH